MSAPYRTAANLSSSIDHAADGEKCERCKMVYTYRIDKRMELETRARTNREVPRLIALCVLSGIVAWVLVVGLL